MIGAGGILGIGPGISMIVGSTSESGNWCSTPLIEGTFVQGSKMLLIENGRRCKRFSSLSSGSCKRPVEDTSPKISNLKAESLFLIHAKRF